MERQVHITLDEEEIKLLIDRGYLDKDSITAEAITSVIHEAINNIPDNLMYITVICTQDVVIDGDEYWSKGSFYSIATKDFSDLMADSNLSDITYMALDDFLDCFDITRCDDGALEKALNCGNAEVREKFAEWQEAINAKPPKSKKQDGRDDI